MKQRNEDNSREKALSVLPQLLKVDLNHLEDRNLMQLLVEDGSGQRVRRKR
jgi:hypothetical protein